ncbi:X2-like carbohydrate binding domain-containing protein [Paenibacillus sp. NPDC058174]|uniref:X2-like carbohydrate binding domain-containing protein n=1 Tax=Paenibacillus sp. NPDC058174 TaxID=3346366 RepID=UPI0036DEE49E
MNDVGVKSILKAGRKRLMVLVFVIVIAQLGILAPAPATVQAADNGLGAKPYMGWSSYSLQVYTGQNHWISAATIKAQSDAMHTTLQPYGYEYINIDAGWNGDMDGYGRPIPSTVHYPNGFQEVIDYVHNNGQKIGIYGIPGLSPKAYEDDLPIYGAPGCSMKDIAAQPLRSADYWGIGYKIDFSNPCAQSYIDSIADLYGEWGIDFLKFDSVTPGSGISDLSMDARDDVAAWSQALAEHNIWLELSWALDINYADYWKEYANGWRVDWDIECYCEEGLTTWSSIARLFQKQEQWWRHGGPGGWNDFDSMNIGNGAMDGITQDERRSAMTLWAMSAAPLYIGNDMTNLDSFGIGLLTNEEVIAVNQAGRPVRPLSTETPQQVWYANNGDGSFTVALFNLGDSAATVNVNWSELGIDGSASVRDLWSHSDLGVFNSGFSSVNLASHASRLLKVYPKGGTVSANDDDHGFKYTGSWSRNGGVEETGGSQNLIVHVSDSTVQNSLVYPAAAGFNKKTAAQADITVDLTLNGNTLSGIANGTATLASGTDYTVSGTQLTIKKGYLAGLPTGQAKLKFTFSAGNVQYVDIEISDTTNGVILSLNDDDPGIVYTGSWQRSWNRGFGDYKDDVHYTETNNDYFQYEFWGTGVSLLTEKDSSQGDIDIYVDGVFKQTVSTHHTSRLAGQTVYSISGLTEGLHTLKAVKKSGTFMLLDQLKVTLPDYIIPAAGTFNKKTTAQADVKTTLTQGGPALTGISNGSAALISGTDYTVSGKTVTIKKEYLASQAAGKTRLTFSFAGGAKQTLSIDVIGVTPQTVSINDNDSGIVYTGTWGYSWNRGLGDYNDDVHYTETNGDYFEYTFSGTGIDLITEKDVSQGDIDIYLDGVFKQTVSTYNASRLAGVNVYSATGLPDGTHTLKVVKKSGTFMLLDRLIVTGTPAIQNSSLNPSAVSFDKKASAQADIPVSLTLNGNDWSGLFNGTAQLAEGTDYTRTGNVITVNKSYLSSLPEGMASLTFAFTGGAEQKLAVAVRDTSRGRYVLVNNDEPGIVYKGGWQNSRNRGIGDYKDDAQYTEANGDYFEYTFKGIGIELVTEKDMSQGDIDIYIDGVFQQTISTQSPNRLVQQAVFVAAGLADGAHTLKAVKKSGQYMLLDQLRIQQSNLFGPDKASFDKKPAQQADVTVTLATDADNLIGVKNGAAALTAGTDYTVAGNQLTVKKQYLANQPEGVTSLAISFRGDYFKDVHQTTANGDAFEYTFTGTGAALIGPKGPEQGEIDIYVDGVFVQTVNAYHASRQTGQTLYSISGLTNGLHTIKGVKKTGSRMLVDQVKYNVPTTP